MNNHYQNLVCRVGSLIFAGVWYSDACEMVIESPPSNLSWWDVFEADVDAYTAHITNTTGRVVPVPKYKTIF